MTMCMPYMRGPTPLSRYARSLGVQEAAVEAQPLLLFPMYTVPLEALMQMSQVVPHEELKEKGILVEFDPSMGHAAFVSHQWVDSQHPDPEFEQMRVLQDALKHAMSSVEISLDVVTATVMPSAKSLPTSKLCSQPLFLWYDYFSCPQLENQAGGESRPCLSKAIDSIPAYITKCSFFFALCPVLENPSGSRLLTPATWAERGWCRVEPAVHELGPCESWILIRSSIELELVVIPAVSPVGCLGGRPPAEGQFSVASDRRKLQPLLEEALKRKLLLLLKAQDFVNYRLLLNLQGIHLRGFPFPRHLEPIPGFQAEDHANVPDRSASVLVAQFLYQNGFSSVNETDQAGWSPLHYGALRGDVSLIQGLLMKRADPNRLTKQDQPSVGLPPFSSALTISVCFKHNAAARVLISAKAQIEGGLLKPMEFAAAGDNPEGVQLLHEAGGQLHARSVMGFTALEIASCRGAASAMLEIVRLAKAEQLDFSGALWCALALKAEGGTASIVGWLLEHRADVNQSRNPWHSSLYGALACTKALQHRFGQQSKATRQFYHMWGATPLVMAMLESQYEGAATLIAAGAKLELCNSRGWSAADFIREQSVPDFLLQALAGNLEECKRVSTVAQSRGYAEKFC